MYDLKPTPESLAEVEEAIRRGRLLNAKDSYQPSNAVTENQLLRLTMVHRMCESIAGLRWTPAEFYAHLSSSGIQLWEKRGKVSQEFAKDAITISDFVTMVAEFDTVAARPKTHRVAK
jgi:hypothetical protein